MGAFAIPGDITRVFDTEGLTIRRQGGAVHIRLPCPTSALHAFRVVGALWEFRDAVRELPSEPDLGIVVDVSAFDSDLPLSMVGILWAMKSEFGSTGRHVRIIGSNNPLLCAKPVPSPLVIASSRERQVRPLPDLTLQRRHHLVKGAK